MTTESISRNMEGVIITRKGEKVDVAWVFSPMKDNHGRVVGVVAVGRDLTEQRKLEMQLLQSQKLNALGVMAGGIAHEIRNPLAISSSCAQFLLDDDITQEFRKECARNINTFIQRASTIIENLLRFSRTPLKTDMTKLDLIAVIQETLSLVANQAKILKIELKSDIPHNPAIISGNKALLQQMFMNLFLNAFTAMPAGGVLGVSVQSGGQKCVVRVADSGHGIPKAEMDRIFDPFYTTSQVGKGTGLGLSLCYSIVTEHFGSIEVESVEGKGSAFTVHLPHYCD